MSAVQSLTGSGGWPMSVWLTPERAPFFGGTYFPPRDGVRGARHGFLTLLRALAETYHRDQARVTDQAETLVAGVRRELEGRAAAPAASLGATEPPDAAVDSADGRVFSNARSTTSNGGLGGAPKFPSSLPVRLLLRYHRRSGDAEALRMATLTLEKMAAGGIYDQIGGGFHRYATDATLARPALREDALRQRPPGGRLPRGVSGHRPGRLRPRRARDARLRPSRDDLARRRLLLGHRRRLRRRRGEVLRLVGGGASRACSAGTPPGSFATTASRRLETSRGATSCTCRRRTSPSAPRSTARASGSTRRGRAGSPRRATTRSSPPGMAS